MFDTRPVLEQILEWVIVLTIWATWLFGLALFILNILGAL